MPQPHQQIILASTDELRRTPGAMIDDSSRRISDQVPQTASIASPLHIPRWYTAGMDGDVRHRMIDASRAKVPFALATITAADGGPRPVGSQMFVTCDAVAGFLSGGCIEADIVAHAGEVLETGRPKNLIYGRGSPFIDLRLPCGARLEVLIERILPDDPALSELSELTLMRQSFTWNSNGVMRFCSSDRGCESDPKADTSAADWARIAFRPLPRLLIQGWDPYALAIAEAAIPLGWQVVLNWPNGPESPPTLPCEYSRASIGEALELLGSDEWTAVAIVTHDVEPDHRAICAALKTDAFYIGVLGSRRKIPERLELLRDAGFASDEINRIETPIGLPIGAVYPREVAISVIAHIIAKLRSSNFDQDERSSEELEDLKSMVQCPN